MSLKRHQSFHFTTGSIITVPSIEQVSFAWEHNNLAENCGSSILYAVYNSLHTVLIIDF